MSSYVYLLLTSDQRFTYVGATINLDRRLRQHNKEIVGGAMYTGSKVRNGEIWERVIHVEGFPEWKTALQFEWRWKHISRKYKNISSPIERRVVALKELLSLDKPTSKSIPYDDWEVKCIVISENANIQKILDKYDISNILKLQSASSS